MSRQSKSSTPNKEGKYFAYSTLSSFIVSPSPNKKLLMKVTQNSAFLLATHKVYDLPLTGIPGLPMNLPRLSSHLSPPGSTLSCSYMLRTELIINEQNSPFPLSKLYLFIYNSLCSTELRQVDKSCKDQAKHSH